MANDKTGDGEDWVQLAKSAAKGIAAAVAAVGGIAVFVAAVGGALVWARFDAAELPADQALDAMPQGELIATGAIALAIFGVLGTIAAGAVALIAHSGAEQRPDPDVLRRGLLLLLAVEAIAIAALAIGEVDHGLRRWVIATVFVVALLAIALALTGAPWSERVRDAESPPDEEAARSASNAVESPDEEDSAGASDTAAGDGPRSDPVTVVALAFVALAAGAAIALAATGGSLADHVTVDPLGGATLLGGLALLGLVALYGWRWMSDARPSRSTGRPRLTRFGVVAVALLAVALVAVPGTLMDQGWVAVALATAVVLAAGAWLATGIREHTFFWYGAVVFVSVPILGAVTQIVANVADPQVQPLALIRADDGDREALQGIYVTETDDHVYLANVASEGCGAGIVPDSGRMTRVARDEIVAMTLGPHQSVDQAGSRALEMYYALAPAAAEPPELTVETAAGGVTPPKPTVATLTVEPPPASAGKADDAAGADAGKDTPDPTDPAVATGDGAAADPATPARRLESTGAAFRREFGAAMHLTRSSAPTGDTVVLRGTGFGNTAEGRTVRVNGVRAEIAERERPLKEHNETQDQEHHWNDWAIAFIVPDRATTGPVTVECEPIAVQPKLAVQHPPRAAVAVAVRGRAGRVEFDSRRSAGVGGGRIVGRRWTINGQRTAGGRILRRDLPARAARYSIGLRVVDSLGETDTANLAVWRLRFRKGPAGFFARHGGRLEAINAELARRSGATVAIHAQVHEPRAGKRPPRATRVARRLRASLGKELRGKARVIRTFGGRCPIALERGAGHVDVFVLGPGIRLSAPAGCRTRTLQ